MEKRRESNVYVAATAGFLQVTLVASLLVCLFVVQQKKVDCYRLGLMRKHSQFLDFLVLMRHLSFTLNISLDFPVPCLLTIVIDC